ncbi:MAG: hypothetical protein Q8L35_04240 [Actinomycetota bacterium]|nr:hypothetical protein [Actinomycetota bacterium]
MKALTLRTVVLGLLIGAALGGSVGQAYAAITVTQPSGGQTVNGSEDFPSRRFVDPWDMDSPLDLSHGVYFNQLKDVRWKNGVFTATTTGNDGHVYPLFPGYLGGLPNGRDGIINRFPTSGYDRFSLRLYSSRATTAQFIWLYNQVFTDVGVKTFAVQQGWHIYNVDPTARGWTGKPMGLRLDPSNHANTKFKIDWIRLYKNTDTVLQIAWTDSSPGGTVNIYLDNDQDAGNGNLGLIATLSSNASNVYNWRTAPYPGGTYYIYIVKSGQAGAYSGSGKINAAPLTKILDPDELGGEDYAQARSGGSWSMNNPTDISDISGIANVGFTNGILAGTTLNTDPHFDLRTLTPIDTARYHRLQFRYRYSGSFDYGLGTIVRFIWSPDRNRLSQYQTIKDIVVYPKWTTYYINLTNVALSHGNIGWNGNMDVFRFDPLETPPQRRFYVDYVRLRADDAANSQFTIKWRDKRANPRPTRVSIYRDTNKTGFNGRLIKSNIAQVAGINRYNWNTSGVPADAYWIYLIATDGVSTTRKYATGPLKISH